jgi:hypothetical protein
MLPLVPAPRAARRSTLLGFALLTGVAPCIASASPAPDDASASSQDEDAPIPNKPPRIDGGWIGVVGHGTLGFVRVNDLSTPGAFSGFGGAVRGGQMILPWFGLGLQAGGAVAVRSEAEARQRAWMGTLLVDLQFVPVPKIPLSVRTSFGFGGGAVREAGVLERAGFGGAMFSGAVRYELFPGVARYRPDRGGGFGLGPELGWIGATPAAAGRPLANFVYLGLSGNFYFGS